MSRLTEKREKPLTTKWEDVPTIYYKIKGDDTGVAISEIGRLNKLGKLEDLEDELKVPLEFILIPYYLSGLKKVWYHNQWCDVVRVVAYEEATTPYMEVRCKDYDYLKFIPLDNYKKTFWLKEDRSE